MTDPDDSSTASLFAGVYETLPMLADVVPQSLAVPLLCGLGFFVFLGLYWMVSGTAQRVFALVVFSALILWIDPLSYLLLLTQGTMVYALTRLRSQSRGLFLAGLAFIIVPFIAHEIARIYTFGTEIYNLVFMTGLAFYSLRLVHYWWEARKGTLPPHDLLSYLAYIFFLPIFVVGPIYRFEDFMMWERRKRWSATQFVTGWMRIGMGLFKIVVLSHFLINDLLQGYADGLTADQTWLLFYIECMAYGLNVYFQFSGYSDIAIGLGLLLGHKVCENFNYPFLQPNIAEFWKRWHMSLTSWVRSYIFLPILLTTKSTHLGILVSMLMIGVWHGFTWNAAAWGLYHGIGINLYYVYKKSALARWLTFTALWPRRLWYGFSVLLTFHYVMLGNFLLK